MTKLGPVRVVTVIVFACIFSLLSWYLLRFFYPQDIYQTLSNSYAPLIGNDETTWLYEAQDVGSFRFYQGFYPYFLSFFIGKSTLILFLLKYILCFFAIYLLFYSLTFGHAKHGYLLFCTLIVASNPYLLLLHATPLRDDLIVSAVLFFACFIARCSEMTPAPASLTFKSTPVIFIFLLSALTFLSIRPIYSLAFLAFSLPVLLIARLSSVVKLPTRRLVCYLLPLLFYQLISAMQGLDTSISPLHILLNLQGMFVSPLPNIFASMPISQSCYGDYACLYQFGFVMTFANASILLWLIVNSLRNSSFVNRFFVSEYFFLFVSSLALPYAINNSQYDIVGPRQALPVLVCIQICFLSYLLRRSKSYSLS